MKQFSILIVIIIFLSSCLHQSKKSETFDRKTSLSKSDTVSIVKALKNLRIDTNDRNYDITYNNDTLIIFSRNDFFGHPFGKYSNVADISKQVDNGTIKNIALFNTLDGDSANITQISTLKSAVKLFYDTGLETQEIVSAEINDQNFHLKSNVQIGITKEELLNTFFYKRSFIPFNIIMFIADFGTKHYYYFKGDKLYRIKMITDYKFEGK